MAKDPAFLFYPGDFDNKTRLMTNEEVGVYIRLLILQFHNGHLNRDDAQRVLGLEIPARVLEKFETDIDGRIYNPRLEEEQQKRRRFTESRRQNKEGKNQHTSGHTTEHTSTHTSKRMENENENENKNDKIKAGTRMKRPDLLEVAAYMAKQGGATKQDAAEFCDYYTSNGWKVGRNPMKDWRAAARNWLKRKSQYKNEPEQRIGKQTRTEITDATDYSDAIPTKRAPDNRGSQRQPDNPGV